MRSQPFDAPSLAHGGPGTKCLGESPTQKIRPVGYGVILAGVRTNNPERLWPYVGGIV